MVHIYIVIVHEFEDELVLFRRFGDFSNAIAITIFLNFDSVHLHF
jgi:hypothetical protein